MMNALRNGRFRVYTRQEQLSKLGYVESASNPRILLTEDGVSINTIYVKFPGNPAMCQENVVRKAFEKIGPVTKVKIITKMNNDRFGFISFERCEDASQCLIQRREFPLMFLNAADSWQQDAYHKENASYHKGDDYSGDSYILQLNDDCLMLIFNHLNLMDLIALKNTCTRIASVVCDVLRRYRSFDFTEPLEKPKLTIMDTKSILESVGPFVQRLTMSRERFAQSKSTCSFRILGLVPRNCLYLKELTIQNFEMNPADLNALEVIVKSLEVLTLHRCGLDDYVGRCLSHCRNLQRLRLSNNSGISGTCLQVVKGLKGLNVASCTKLKLNSFIESNAQLEYLDITGCVINNNTFDLISRLTKLTHLACNDRYTTEMSTKVVEIPNITKLTLTVTNSQCTDQILQMFAERNCLEYAELICSVGQCLKLQNKYILKMTKLKEFTIISDFLDEFLEPFYGRTNIETIKLTHSSYTVQPQLIEIVKRSPQLKLLDISGCYIDHLSLFLELYAVRRNGSILEVIISSHAWNGLQKYDVDLALTNYRWLKVKVATDMDPKSNNRSHFGIEGYTSKLTITFGTIAA